MLSNSPLGKQAIVLGGSTAGLLAARVLTEYFSEYLCRAKLRTSLYNAFF
jgi:hypothetical protein